MNGMTKEEYKQFQLDYWRSIPNYELKKKYPYLNDVHITSDDLRDFALRYK